MPSSRGLSQAKGILKAHSAFKSYKRNSVPFYYFSSPPLPHSLPMPFLNSVTTLSSHFTNKSCICQNLNQTQGKTSGENEPAISVNWKFTEGVNKGSLYRLLSWSKESDIPSQLFRASLNLWHLLYQCIIPIQLLLVKARSMTTQNSREAEKYYSFCVQKVILVNIIIVTKKVNWIFYNC